MLSRAVGVLHLRTHKHPLPMLRHLLNKASPLQIGSLIVLPETIDVEGRYSDTSEHTPYTKDNYNFYLNQLEEVSQAHDIDIVAGLRTSPTTNSAILFRRDRSRQIIKNKTSSNHEPDLTGDHRVVLCHLGNNETVSSLICLDCSQTDQTDAMKDIQASYIAIPAASSSMSFAEMITGDDLTSRPWIGNSWCLFANSSGNSWIGRDKVLVHAGNHPDALLLVDRQLNPHRFN